MPAHAPPCSRIRRPRLAALAALLLAAGCGDRAPAVDSESLTFAGAQYRVVRIDLRRDALSLHWRDPDSGNAFASIEALRRWGAAHGRNLLFAANAGIYDRKGAPLGLHVEGGRIVEPLNTAHGDPRAGNFSLRPNGVFFVDADGRAHIQATAAYRQGGAHPRLATQSGPMLVVDGEVNPQFVADSGSLKWRSGVCARSPRTVVFAISETPVNFHAFARLFRDRLHCRDALYLDGSISQFYIDGSGYVGAPGFMVKPYAGMFAVFGPRAPSPAGASE